MNTFFVQHKKALISFCVLFVLTFLLYFKTVYLGFFSDDYHFLYIISRAGSIWKFFLSNNVGGVEGGSYGPILNVLWGIQYTLFGMHPAWYHVVLLSAYTMTAWFIYLFSYRLGGHVSLGWASAVLFLVLQNHTSSIAWIAVMPHVWATLFFVAGLYSYYRYITEHQSWRYVFAFVLMMLSLFTKETAIMFPLVLIWMDLLFSVSYSRCWHTLGHALKRVSLFILGTILYLIIRYSIVGYVAGYYAQSEVSFRVIPKIQMFIEIVLSMGLTSPYRQLATQFLMQYWGILIFGIAILIILFLLLSNAYKKILGFLLGSYIIMSIPFVNLMFDPTSNSGERYGYMLSVFFVMIVTIWLFALSSRISWRKIGFWVVVCCVVMVSGLQMFAKLDVWYVSAEIRDTIIENLKFFDFHENDYIIFVATPDNIAGVELMRNAIREMIDLETTQGLLQGDRIPLYIEPRVDTIGKQVIYLDGKQNQDNQYIIASNQEKIHMFTGFPVFEHKTGVYKLVDFRHYDHSGSGITMQFDQAFLESTQGRVLLLYFDGQMMQFMTIKE